ncbi:MAG: hypothetical protein KGV50_04730 [Gammaproteobacteria bacterium]|nr:hypothetical protein [Gammaproteobacteria bacterium]
MIRKKTKMMLAVGAATLIGGTVVTTASANEDLGKCVGVNSCKGQSACQTASSSCAGQNTCKGKGWIKTTAKDCKSKKGTFESL